MRRAGRIALVVAALAAGSPAAASDTEPGTLEHSWYLLYLRAAAIEPEVDVPARVLGVGYSQVNLAKDRGHTGVCEAKGAGAYWTDEIESPGLHDLNPGPRPGLVNPTEARDSADGLMPPVPPSDDRIESRSRRPHVRSPADRSPILAVPAHGDGVHWAADCANSAAGTATGATTDVAGARAAGSTTSGRVDAATGEYRGTARAYVAGLATPSGTLDLVSSVMAVRAFPGREPRVTYRIATTGGTLAAGSDVPTSELAAQFNRSVRANAATLDALGPFGLTLMGPTASTTPRAATADDPPNPE